MHNANFKIRIGDLVPSMLCAQQWAMAKQHMPSCGTPMLNERQQNQNWLPSFWRLGSPTRGSKLATYREPSRGSPLLSIGMKIRYGDLTQAFQERQHGQWLHNGCRLR